MNNFSVFNLLSCDRLLLLYYSFIIMTYAGYTMGRKLNSNVLFIS